MVPRINQEPKALRCSEACRGEPHLVALDSFAGSPLTAQQANGLIICGRTKEATVIDEAAFSLWPPLCRLADDCTRWQGPDMSTPHTLRVHESVARIAMTMPLLWDVC
jgi:hypothetical protein